MISAYEHGRTAANHGKHIQACPFDTGTREWREWRQGFCEEPVTSLKGLCPLSHGTRKTYVDHSSFQHWERCRLDGAAPNAGAAARGPALSFYA